MDIQTPIMDGVAAILAIRTLHDFRRLNPGVAVTADTLAAQLENYRDARISDWIEKPVDIDILVEKTFGWANSGGRQRAADIASASASK